MSLLLAAKSKSSQVSRNALVATVEGSEVRTDKTAATTTMA